ncbi:hypothetical protein CHGG_05632 [Chaetomium globosum CBS 148.51]|uniref:GPI ethanolamine phosphate transferase 2 n=1 Tax=Chaetomium globosum (strain ATCC 6205 / CBS 148.51 / DSM 1962 / NBRC 6347 / NRRL 1970) TaxID=306901 RepID=Q2H6T3_CHAGB|nr:uncharacterized protein CHGG_05632 [Chaetomium globosum CBS 148.51]EAQ89013.1 hypothetical protein CHGG_05632 [Chaetomium globosum CBS 148.51]
MAKSSRSSVIKSNNRRLKKNVFGPVESARAERLSAKLLALAAEAKPVKDVEMNEEPVEETKDAATKEDTAMEVEDAKPVGKKPGGVRSQATQQRLRGGKATISNVGPSVGARSTGLVLGTHKKLIPHQLRRFPPVEMTAHSRRDGTLSSVFLLAANILIPIAIFVFATGFFPYKPLLSGLATYDTVTEYGDPPAAPFDRLVFMVIDALRRAAQADRPRLIRDGAALPFTAHATSPTVTMPRLKAITTGSIPSFLDVVLNLDEGDESSSLASQDTWLAQMKAKGTGKLVMYGDDTWLKLFPGTFDRADGTTSFFVSTTLATRVDQGAIEAQDHLQSTLFVVCGDHGMNDAGNHGASSPGETSPALVFMSPKLRALKSNLQSPMPEDESFQYYSTVEQSDVAPTLAALLGFPVPKNNLGALIPEFLPFWSNRKDQVQLLMRNARQIRDIVLAVFGPGIFESNPDADAATEPNTDYRELALGWERLAGSYSKGTGNGDHSQLIVSTTKWLRHAQGVLSSMASNYDTSRLFLGQATAGVALVAAIIAAAWCAKDKLVSFTPLSGIVLAYGAMMFASSYVEEEHHFWYWATTAWFAYLGIKGYKRYVSRHSPSEPLLIRNRGNVSAARQTLFTTALLLTTRIIRGWNQTGQKFAGEPDIVKTYLNTNPALLWCLIGATYLWVHQNLVYGLSGLPIWLSFTTTTGLVLAAFTFKVAFTLEDAPELVTDLARYILKLNFTHGATLITRARAVFIGLALLTAITVLFMLARRRISLNQSGMPPPSPPNPKIEGRKASSY